VNGRERNGVLAVVVTFNAPDGASACVEAIQSQTSPPDAILIVDNDSAVPADKRRLGELGSVPVEVLRLCDNRGPAGGYAAGLEWFGKSEQRYAWVLDDDVFADSACLEHLVDEMSVHQDRAVVCPLNYDLRSGEYWQGRGWVGALIPRGAVEAAGVPDARLFWGLEDQEYFRDRLTLAGFPGVWCERAVTRIVIRDEPVAPWKWYYKARNQTYRYLYKRTHIRASVRLKSLVNGTAQDVTDIWRSGTRRPASYARFFIGVVDGAFCRLGKRVSPGSGDRPWRRQSRAQDSEVGAHPPLGANE
jgi:GT2 family glycosyltransferase